MLEVRLFGTPEVRSNGSPVVLASGRAQTLRRRPGRGGSQAMVKAGLPPIVAATIVDVFGSYRAGAMAHTSDTVRTLTGREPGAFARFALDHATIFGAGAPAPAGAAAPA